MKKNCCIIKIVILIVFQLISISSISEVRAFHFFRSKINVSVNAQPIIPLKIGSKVPEIDFGLKYGSKGISKAKLSDYKGKLLVLDFWSVACPICIAELPRLKKLQEQFGDKVAILPVGFDGRLNGSIMEFITKRKQLFDEMLPTAIQSYLDTTLMSLFPFHGLPHEVWIDSNGRFLGATDHLAVNEETIQNVLDGKGLNATFKYIRKSLGNDAEFLISKITRGLTYETVVCGLIDSLVNKNPIGVQYDSNYTRIFDANKTIYYYYRFAYNNNEFENRKRIIVESPGRPFYKDFYDAPSSNVEMAKFRKDNLFCFELVLPIKNGMDSARELMKKVLDSTFYIKSRIEKKRIKCLVLKAIDDSEKFKSKEYSQSNLEDRLNFKFRHLPMNLFINKLNNLLDPIVINETGYEGMVNVDIILTKNYDLNNLLVELNKNGLSLSYEEREMDMLVLKNRTATMFNISGKFKDTTDRADKVYLIFAERGKEKMQEYVADSALVSLSGTYHFSGDISDTTVAYLFVGDFRPPLINKIQLFIEPGCLLNVTTDGFFSNSLVTGTKLNEDLLSFRKNVVEYATKELTEFLNTKYYNVAVEKRDSVAYKKEEAKYFERFKIAMKTYVLLNTSSLVSLQMLKRYSDIMRLDIDDYVRPLFNSLSESVRNTSMGISFDEFITGKENTNIGGKALGFKQKDINGDTIELLNFRGKYVLLDFWASWCKPCREEFPQLKNIYHQFKNKNFVILGVSLDSFRDNWERAVKEDQLNWYHVSDLNRWDNAIARKYAIKAIPANFLIDPNGIIIGKNLGMKELNDKLKSIL